MYVNGMSQQFAFVSLSSYGESSVPSECPQSNRIVPVLSCAALHTFRALEFQRASKGFERSYRSSKGYDAILVRPNPRYHP